MLDPWTLWVCTGFMALISAMALLLAWILKIHQNRNVAGFRDWVAGRFVALAGLVILSIEYQYEPTFTMVVGNMLVIIGLWLEFDGLRNFIEEPASSQVQAVIGGIGLFLLMTWLALVAENRAAVDMISAGTLTLIGLWCALTIWPEREEKEVWALRGVAWVFGIHSLAYGVYLMLAFLAVLDPKNTMADHFASYEFSFQTMFFVVAGAIGYLAITAEELHSELQRQAESDSLTGVYNRRAFHAIAKHSLLRQHRKQDDMSVVILDLDHFKQVNDRFGHAAGDQVLKEVAQVIESTRRESDLLARFGGEEFVVLLPATGPSAAAKAAERFRVAIENVPIVLEDESVISVSASFGVASLDIDELIDDVDILINRADEALYEAKSAGRNQVSIWQRPDTSADQHQMA